MPPRTVQYSFSHGEVSEEFLGGRLDVNRYYGSCRVLEGYLPLLTGGVELAPGTRFMALAKTAMVRLARFEFNVEQAYMLEFGEQYIRFFTEAGRLENPPGTPVEVATPFLPADLFTLQMVQSADVLYIVHPAYDPRKLIRLDATTFELRTILFHPPPALEVDFAPAATLTLSALTGTITATASAAVFLDADIDRLLVHGAGLAVITALNTASPATAVTATVLDAFSAVGPLAQGTWFLGGSPVADCTPSRLAPVGSRVMLSLSNADVETPNLLTMTGWTDLSGPTVTTGTATGGSNTTLIDTTKDFLAAGVQAGHRVIRTLGGEGRADTIATTTNPFDTVNMNPGLSGGAVFVATNAYTIRQTGSFTTSANQFTLNPGENGLSWGEKSATVVNARVYEVEFTVHTHPVTAQVGTTTGTSDLFAEASFSPGVNRFQFTASGTSAFVQFRNAQSPNIATITGVKLQLISVEGWRAADVGSVVQIFGGAVEIIQIIDPTRARGIIWWPLDPGLADPEDPIPPALAGAWTLNQPVWTPARGFPRALSFYQSRLGFAGAPILGVWLSANGLFENMALGPNDDQAVFNELTSNTMNAIEWLEPLRDLLIGSRTSEQLLRGGQLGITPSASEKVPLTTDNGSNPLRPLRLNTALYQLGRGGRTIYEVQLDKDLNAVTESRDILIDARHLLDAGSITQWTAQTRPVRRLWAVRSDGQLLCFTVDLTESVRGWARRTTQGTVLSVETLPLQTPTSTASEQVWVAVQRQNGTCIEVMEPGLTVDSALSYSGPAVSVVSGAGHLEGQQVVVLNEGAVETHTVLGGAVTLDRPGTAVTLGLGTTPRVHLPRLELPLRDGTMQGLKKRIIKAMVRLKDSMGLTINGESVPFRRTFDPMDTAPPARDEDVTALLRGWTDEGYIEIAQPLPFPSTILLVTVMVEFEET